MRYLKMNGLGNDFVVLDARKSSFRLTPDELHAIADRETGIGCDQIIALEPSRAADVFMRIWNADGSEVGACGNATRCVATLIAEERSRPAVTIETGSGVLSAIVRADGLVAVDMGIRASSASTVRVTPPRSPRVDGRNHRRGGRRSDRCRNGCRQHPPSAVVRQRSTPAPR